MTENLRESISALMDNEANEVELHRVLKSMREEEHTRATWHRYQLASAALKGQLNEHTAIDISARVSERIAYETVEERRGDDDVTTSPGTWSKLSKPFTNVAVAASVAFVVIFASVQIGQQETLDLQSTVVEQGAPAITTTPSGIVLNGVQTVAATDANAQSSDLQLTPAQKRLRDMMHKHAQQADLSSGTGVRPYVQLVDMQESRR